MSDFATREKNRAYYQEHREQILRATKEWRKRNREKYRAYQKEYWSKHYRNYGTKNRVADRAMRGERKKPDVEKAPFNVQESAAGSASGMAARKQKRIIGREFNNRVFNQRGQKGMAPYQNK